MSMELVFERNPPTFDREGGSVSARQGHCAQSQRGDEACALSNEESVGNVWVPPPNAWGTTYQMRIVEEAQRGIFCVPGALGRLRSMRTTPSTGSLPHRMLTYAICLGPRRDRGRCHALSFQVGAVLQHQRRSTGLVAQREP